MSKIKYQIFVDRSNNDIFLDVRRMVDGKMEGGYWKMTLDQAKQLAMGLHQMATAAEMPTYRETLEVELK